MLTTMVSSIAARITALELAVIAVGRQEFGDSAGHPFRGNQWTAGADGSIKDIMDHVRNLPGSRGDKAADHVNPDDLKALGSAAAQLHDTNAYNEATANAPHGDVPHSMTVDGAKTEDAAMIREVRDNPQGAPTGTAQKVADYLERERGGSTDSDQIDWNEVGRSEYVPAAEPEQRHGLAQDRSSYDSDVETFSIDDDGTVTFGDSPGHPFRGNQYGTVPTGRSRDTGEGSGLREVQLKEPSGATGYAEQGSKAHDDAMRNLDEQRFPKSVLKTATDEQLHQLHRDVKDANGRNTWAESDRFSRRTANALDTREGWIKDELNRRGVEPQAEPYQPNQMQGTRD